MTRFITFTASERISGRLVATGLAVVLLLALALSWAATPHAQAKPRATIVLAHGAFADGSSWGRVTGRLQRDGYTVLVPSVPLRGVATDASYLASVVASIDGPVVLAGHSYAGLVIGQAAAGLSNVKGLVYVDGLALDVGERASAVGSRFTDNLLGPALISRPFPLGEGKSGKDLYVDPAKFPAIFGADLPRGFARVLAASQRPIAASAFDEEVTAAAWKTIPSSFVFGAKDRAIDPAELMFLARRARGPVTVIKGGSHLSLLSHPKVVARVIARAAS